MIFSPLEQFEITLICPLRIYGWNISLTNFTLFLFIVFLILMLFFKLSLYESTIVPNNWQALNEILYEFTIRMIKDTLGRKGEFYFPFVFVMLISLVWLSSETHNLQAIFLCIYDTKGVSLCQAFLAETMGNWE